MDLINTTDPRTEQFIERWHQAAGSELATAQSFVIELCELLGVERPHATADQDYMFERPSTTFPYLLGSFLSTDFFSNRLFR